MKEASGISIAVLTRSQEDVEHVNATLRSAGHAAHCHWAADPERFDKAMMTAGVELIVLYTERYGDGIRQVVRQKNSYQPELPVIAVKGEISEAAIQAAMKDGARDLVSAELKSRWLAVMQRELRALRLERALTATMTAATEYKRQLDDYMQRSDSAIAYTQDGIVTRANGAWIDLFQGRSEDDIVGMPLMDSFAKQSHAAIKGALIATLKGKWQTDERIEARGRTTKDNAATLELAFQLAEFEDGAHVRVSIEPPAARVEEPTKLVHDALQRDPTTLFYHRSQFLERLQKRLAKKPTSGMHILAAIRPDHFSTTQGDVGVIASEEVLAQLAEQLRLRLHRRDFAGRFEGTTLMVLLERGNESDAEVWGQQLVSHIREHEFVVGERSVHLTCTVGVCAASGVYSTLEELVAATMETQRLGRKAGGNTVRLNDSDDEDTRQRRFDAIWVKHIRAALMEKRFRLAHLPIAGLRNEAVGMYDMLVRMLDEQGNSVLPSEFLPAAERNNLMKTIDRWIITASMQFCIEEKAELVFVRLSRHSLKDPSLVEWVCQELGKRGLEPGKICMQVAERDAAKHIKLARSQVQGFRKAHIPMALSHYGVDKNRLQILDILKPSFIKIDGELMHSLTTDTVMQENVRALAAAAEQRGILTIAERVENANAMAILFQLGVNFMQGHYVHEPEVVLAEPPSVAATSLEAIVNS